MIDHRMRALGIGYPPEAVERVRALYGAGHTQSEIAERLGVTQHVISRLMRCSGIATRVPAKRNQRGALNHMWRGAAAGYKSMHSRVYSSRGNPKHCEVCGRSDGAAFYEWANLSGHYDNPADYKRMCRSCHRKFDGAHKNFKGARRAD